MLILNIIYQQTVFYGTIETFLTFFQFSGQNDQGLPFILERISINTMTGWILMMAGYSLLSLFVSAPIS